MKIGIALGGGGAKGFAHIGVLKTLVKAGIPIDIVSGTSIGALVGATFIADKLTELEEYARALKLTDVAKLLSPTWSISGMFNGMGALERLDRFIPQRKIEELPKKFAAVSVDLNTAERYVFRSGDLRTALRSSFAIPGIFTPVAIEDPSIGAGRVLVDGGVIDPVPVETARELGADFVIAVDLFSNYVQIDSGGTLPVTTEYLWRAGMDAAVKYFRTLSAKLPLADKLFPAEKAEKKVLNVLEITERSLAVMQRSITSLQLKTRPPDIAIEPATHTVGLLDFHKGAHLIEVGEAAALAQLPAIHEALRVQS